MEVTTQLRDYQHDMLQALDKAWRRTRSVMVQMPTGTGKTVLLAEVIRRELRSEAAPSKGKGEQKGGVLVVAHRRELIDQIKRTIDSFGTDREHVLVESIQKLAKRGLPLTPFLRPYGDKRPKVERPQTRLPVAFPKREGNFKPSLVIVDEAHHALAKTYKMLWERWPEAKFLGLTATPCRLSGEPFTDLFDVLLQSWSIKKFVKKGWLSDMEYVSVRSNSVILRKVAGLSKRGTDGDYQTKEMANVLDTPESIEHLYNSYRKYAEGKKGIVYAINRNHAQHIAAYYQKQGLSCAAIDFKTPCGERQRLVDDYRKGRLQILSGCDIFSEGFDVPEVEFIQLARPTLSLSKYLQQLGRGMRISDGKEKVTILDQVGLYLIFGLPTIERDWQGLFQGKLKGKGQPLSPKGIMAWAGGQDKVLVNEEMFRVGDYIERDGQAIEIKKNRGPLNETRTETFGKERLSIFKEKGLYGIKKGTTVSCPAQYTQIHLLKQHDRYFALALPSKENTGGFEQWTVISLEGEDLKVCMTGEYIGEKDGVFEYRTKENGRLVICLHDVDNHECFADARMEEVGGLQFFHSYKDGTYILRGASTYRWKLRRDDIIYNDCLAIIGNDLFVKTDGNRHYLIAAYRGDCVIVRNGEALLEIGNDGRSGAELQCMPADVTAMPDFLLLGLKRGIALSAAAGAGTDSLLRDYQKEMLSLFYTGRKYKRVLLQIPTGTGKSWMAIPPIREEIKLSSHYYHGQAKKVLIVTHRDELVGQIRETLERCGIHPRIMEAGFFDFWEIPDVTIVTASFIQKRLKSIGHDYIPSLIVIDEAHLIPKSVYSLITERWPKAKYLGMTATPEGENNLMLKKVFNRFVLSWSLQKLIDRGWLKDIDYVDVGLDVRMRQELTALRGKDEHGDYLDSDLSKLFDTPAEIERLCQAYLKYANGRRGIVCAINQKHALHIADKYKEHGIEAAVCMDLTTEKGKQQVENLRNGNLKVLVEVRQFSDGFRCPDIEFVQLACPTRLQATFLHQVGCGMRKEKKHYVECEPAEECNKLLVLDLVGAKSIFGLPHKTKNPLLSREG